MSDHGQARFCFLVSGVEFEASGIAIDRVSPFLQFLEDRSPQEPGGGELVQRLLLEKGEGCVGIMVFKGLPGLCEQE